MADGRRTNDWWDRDRGRHGGRVGDRREYGGKYVDRAPPDFDEPGMFGPRDRSYQGDERNWDDGGRLSFGQPFGQWSDSDGYSTDNPNRPSRDYRGAVGRGGYGGRERNWMDRAGDEVQSWFGDDDAAQRRDMDRRRDGHHGKGPRGYKRSDDRIAEDVNDRLTDDWRLDASDVTVTVSECEVTLSGTVMSREEKRRAEDLADSISGVRHVQNNLRVESRSGSGASETFGSITGDGG